MTQRRNRTKDIVRKTNNVLKNAGRIANDLDRIAGGQLIKYNPYGQLAAKASNYVSRGLDYFDSLLPVEGYTQHPQISGGMSAGVSQTIDVRRTKPRFTNSSGTVRITHKELVGEVAMINSTLATSPTNGGGQSVMHISPTNVTLFPWLSKIASSYDYFKFNRLRFVYVPFCSTATTGRVMMAVDPDATDALTYTRSSLSSYSNSVDSAAWGMCHLDAKLPNNQPWYQTNPVTSVAQYSTSSQGQFFWATWGGGVTSFTGEIYVLYDVSLKDPQPSVTDVVQSSGNGAVVSVQPSIGGPYVVSSTANTIVLTFLATGTYDILFSAATTAATAAIGVVGTAILLATQYDRVGDGAGAMGAIQVAVDATGNSQSPGVISLPSSVTFNGLAALGLWRVSVSESQRTNSYP